MQIFNEILYELFYQFGDPKKRIFLGYIVLSLFIAFFWLVFNYQKTCISIDKATIQNKTAKFTTDKF